MTADAIYTVLFYCLAATAVVLAVSVVSARRLLRGAIALMGVLLMSAGLYVLLGAAFLAGIQVLVYVGGILVLIVFAIMLTRSADLQEDRPSPMRKALGAVAALAFFAITVAAMLSLPIAHGTGAPAAQDETKAIGRALLDYGANGYALPFEIISLLLLAAVIGGIVVARKTPPEAQPFTSGGDLPGEARVEPPRTQREPAQEAGR